MKLSPKAILIIFLNFSNVLYQVYILLCIVLHNTNYICLILSRGGYPDSNREPTVPHTVALPIELYLPY